MIVSCILMKICFSISGLNILNETVDKFIIAEATKTHSGEDKKLNFDIKKFLKFKDKINYLVIDDIPLNGKL